MSTVYIYSTFITCIYNGYAICIVFILYLLYKKGWVRPTRRDCFLSQVEGMWWFLVMNASHSMIRWGVAPRNRIGDAILRAAQIGSTALDQENCPGEPLQTQAKTKIPPASQVPSTQPQLHKQSEDWRFSSQKGLHHSQFLYIVLFQGILSIFFVGFDPRWVLKKLIHYPQHVGRPYKGLCRNPPALWLPYAPDTSGTLSATCAGAIRNFIGHRNRTSSAMCKPREPCLHHTVHNLISHRTLRNFVCICTGTSRTSSTICTGALRNLISHLHRNPPHQPSAPEGSGTPSAIWTGTLRNFISYLHRKAPEPSGTFSGTWKKVLLLGKMQGIENPKDYFVLLPVSVLIFKSFHEVKIFNFGVWTNYFNLQDSISV